MKNFSLYTQRHPFHLVDPSIMPFITALSALTLTSGSVMYFHGYTLGLKQHSLVSFLFFLVCSYDDVTLYVKEL